MHARSKDTHRMRWRGGICCGLSLTEAPLTTWTTSSSATPLWGCVIACVERYDGLQAQRVDIFHASRPPRRHVHTGMQEQWPTQEVRGVVAWRRVDHVSFHLRHYSLEETCARLVIVWFASVAAMPLDYVRAAMPLALDLRPCYLQNILLVNMHTDLSVWMHARILFHTPLQGCRRHCRSFRYFPTAGATLPRSGQQHFYATRGASNPVCLGRKSYEPTMKPVVLV